MRESLTIFAGLLILILTVALVGPYLVDWTAERGWVEKLLSDATGAHVEVAGAIDLKLLPTPSLRLEKVVMSGAAPGDASFRVDSLELQMAVAPLLRGDVQFIDADFETPELRLTLGADGSLVLPNAPVALPAAMQFSAISLHHGRVTIDDPSAKRSFALTGLNLDAEADSLVGPFKGSGRFARSQGGAVGFDFHTTALQSNQLVFKASFEPTSTTPAADFAGALDFSGNASGATQVSFDGNAAISGTLKLPGAAALAWKIGSPVKADTHRVTFTSLDLRLGNEDHALAATGTGQIDLQGAPQAQASFDAQQVDLDALLATQGGGNADIQPLVKAFSDALSDSHLTESLAMPVEATFASPALVFGGETLTDLAVKLDMRAGAPVGLDFKAAGPGRSRLALSGAVETGSAADFKGHMEASMRDKARFAGWLGMILPSFADRLRALPIRTFDLTGDLDMSGAGFAARGLKINADQSKLGGTIAFTRAIGTDRARLFADLSAEALDLDALPDLSGTAAVAADTDLALTLDARAIRVARFGQGVVDAGHIHLELTKTGQRTTLKNFSIANLGGASVSANGLATPEAIRLEANLDADRLNDLAALVRRVAPGAAADMFAARATALSPAHLELTAAARPAKGSVQLVGLILTGTARGTQIDAAANPDSADPQNISANLTLDSADTPMLLRQLGLDTVSLSGFGRGHVGVEISGRPGGDFDTDLKGSLAGTDLTFQGRLGGTPGVPQGSGAFMLKTANLTPLMEIATVALPDATAKLAADLTGKLTLDSDKLAIADLAGSFAGTPTQGHLTIDLATRPASQRLSGALAFDHLSATAFTSAALGPAQAVAKGSIWPSGAFGTSLVAVPTADLALSATTFDFAPGVAGHDAKLHLGLSPGLLTLNDIQMKVGDGGLGGRLTVRRDGPAALVSGRMQLDGLAFQAPYVSASAASGTIDFTATGRSEAALAASLAGSGTVRFAGLTFEKSDPDALARIITATDQGTVAVDEPEVRSALGRELDRSALRLDDATYDANMAGGVLRLTPQKGAGGSPRPPGGDLSAAIDLQHATIDARLAITSKTAPRDWAGPPPQAAVVWRGPIAAAKRDLDSASFFNTLAARAFVREAARADLLEHDIRERAYFNRYLKGLQFMRRRAQEIAAFEAEQARQAAAAQAEAARRAADQARQAEAAHINAGQPELAAPPPINLHPGAPNSIAPP